MPTLGLEGFFLVFWGPHRTQTATIFAWFPPLRAMNYIHMTTCTIRHNALLT